MVYSLVRISDGYKVPRIHISQLKRYFAPAVSDGQPRKSPLRSPRRKETTKMRKVLYVGTKTQSVHT